MGRRTVHKMEQERVVEECLKDKSLTLQGIADEVGFNYYTVRRIVEELVAKRRVRLDGTRDKARLYTYNGNRVDEHEYIPRVQTPTANRKAHFLLGAAAEPYDSEFVRAVVNLPYHLAKLFYFAQHAGNGFDVKEDVNVIHKEMMDDYANLRIWEDIYTQILDDPTWWHMASLAQITRDKDFPIGQSEKIMKQYADAEKLQEARKKAEYGG